MIFLHPMAISPQLVIVPELEFHQINNRFTTRTYIYHTYIITISPPFLSYFALHLCLHSLSLFSSLLSFPSFPSFLFPFLAYPFVIISPPSPSLLSFKRDPFRHLAFSSLVSPFTFYDHPSFTGLLAATAPTTTLIILPLCISFISFSLLASLPPSIHQHASQSLSLSTGLFLTLDIAGVPSSFSPHNSTTTQHQCHKVRTTTTSLTPIHPHSRSSPSLPLLLVEKS